MAVLYLMENDTDRGGKELLRLYGSYGCPPHSVFQKSFKLREGLIGQVGFEKRTLHIQEVPESFKPIESGLGYSVPREILVLPIVFENRVRGVIEIATLGTFQKKHLNLLSLV